MVLCGALVAGCSPEREPAPGAHQDASPPPTLSWNGYGTVRFGMTVDEATRAAGPHSGTGRSLEASCDYIRFASLPGVNFMVENMLIARGDADSGTANSLGIGVGATFDSVKSAHPEGRVGPHKYVPDGHYITFVAPDQMRAIVAEEEHGVVTRIRAGLEPAVGYVEGCG
jgi:hypothetical protein